MSGTIVYVWLYVGVHRYRFVYAREREREREREGGRGGVYSVFVKVKEVIYACLCEKLSV